jgi:uncharacterized protein (DUF885 family)
MHRRLLLNLAVAACATACAAPSPRTPASPAPAVAPAASAAGEEGLPAPTTEAGRALRRAQDAVWEKTLADSLYLRLQYGLPIDHLVDVSFERAQADAAFAQGILDRLDGIDAGELDGEEKLSLEILRRQERFAVDGLEFFWLTSPVTPYASPLPLVHRVFTEFRFRGDDDAGRYLDLLDRYVALIGQVEDRLRRQAEQGIVLPRAEIALIGPMVKSWIREPGKSLFTVAAPRLAALSPAAAADLDRRVAAAVGERIDPALAHLADYLQGDYLGQAPEAVGLWQYPGGDRYYRYLVRFYTTLDVTPEQVHATGVAEVARLEERMAAIRAQLGFSGSKEEFNRSLREDPRFLPASAEAIGERLRRDVAEIEPRIGRLFSTVPKAAYDVARLDPSLEGAMTYGYYRPPTEADPRGLYFYNGSKPEERSLIWSKALIYHELIPGHHFQIALQHENRSLHPLRREGFYAAFTEGWAEYAAGLGEELGVYSDPYDLYGRCAQEIFLAERLVVDTGMNDMHWSRQQAIDAMREHTLESDVQIATETLRYAVDLPGQALAYKMGSLTIQRLRRQAEEALGDRFDVREFHRVVLDSGAMPLTVLEEKVDAWVTRVKAAPAGG